jgi:hypothetical protein
MQNIQDLLAKRQILKPRSVVITSRYFWRKWRPILGNSLAILIIEARQKCYRNLQTGEVRNWFYATLKELGQTAGFSPKKLTGLLRLPHAQKFIRYKPTYIYNPDLGKRVKGKCLFQVTLDDPLIPEDELGLAGQDIHSGAINPSQPWGQRDDGKDTLSERPNGDKVCNNYSTISTINRDLIYNNTITRSEKGEHLQTIAENEAIQRDICQTLGANSILLRTVLQSCFIGAMQMEEGLAIVTFNAPNRYYQQVIDTRLKRQITQILEDRIQRRIVLRIINRGENGLD